MEVVKARATIGFNSLQDSLNLSGGRRQIDAVSRSISQGSTHGRSKGNRFSSWPLSYFNEWKGLSTINLRWDALALAAPRHSISLRSGLVIQPFITALVHQTVLGNFGLVMSHWQDVERASLAGPAWETQQ